MFLTYLLQVPSSYFGRYTDCSDSGFPRFSSGISNKFLQQYPKLNSGAFYSQPSLFIVHVCSPIRRRTFCSYCVLQTNCRIYAVEETPRYTKWLFSLFCNTCTCTNSSSKLQHSTLFAVPISKQPSVPSNPVVIQTTSSFSLRIERWLEC
jgi:hypothetical protein